MKCRGGEEGYMIFIMHHDVYNFVHSSMLDNIWSQSTL